MSSRARFHGKSQKSANEHLQKNGNKVREPNQGLRKRRNEPKKPKKLKKATIPRKTKFIIIRKAAAAINDVV